MSGGNANDQDVQEATAALKGMLGIGAPSSQSGGDASGTPASSNQSTPAKGNKNKGKKNQKKNQGNPSSGPGNKNDSNNPKTPNAGKAKKKKGKGKGNSGKQKQENFAWSAFQSSPDASKLPIPAFSPAGEAKPISSMAALAPQPQDLTNLPSAAAMESNMIQTAAKAPSNIQPAPQPATPRPEEERVQSATGINLAAKIKSSNSPKLNPTLSRSSPTTIPNSKSGALPPPAPVDIAANRPPLPPQAVAGVSPMTSTAAPPPPGYAVIQVQVPLQPLGPDRRIMVPTPNGFPVHVQVPMGVPPGAILPVHVPTMPPHMMPPPGHPVPGGTFPHPGGALFPPQHQMQPHKK